MRRAVFAGFFSLGRKPTAIQKLIFSLADRVIAPSVCLVADAHYPQKLHAYIRGGLNDRLLSSAPDTDVLEVFFEDLDGFDLSDYEYGLSMLRVIAPGLLELVSGMEWSGKHPASQHTRRRFDSFVRSRIIPSLVRRRLRDYGVSLNRIRVYSQRGIQQSAFRLSSELPPNDSRREIFLEGSKRGGLIFNLFNELAQQGVVSCTHFCVGRFGSLFVDAEESMRRLRNCSPDFSDKSFVIHGLPFREAATNDSFVADCGEDGREIDTFGRGLPFVGERRQQGRFAA
jgi:hypothetical protein